MAARTVFAMLYIGAVEPVDHWLAPKHVFVMSDAQMRLRADQERLAYATSVVKSGYVPLGQRWYADNTREPIRDETLKDGLGQLGAVALRSGIPTTSSKGRYALHADFAALFDPQLTGAALDGQIAAWQATHLSRGALARIQIIKRGAVGGTG